MFRHLNPHLNLFQWQTQLPPHHPERLPTVMPFVLGLTAGVIGLGALAGVPLLLLLAPLLFAGCCLLPLSKGGSAAIEAGAIAFLLLLILLIWQLSWDQSSIRQAMVLGIVLWLSPKIRQRLLRQEWQRTSQTILAALTQDQIAQDPQQAIAYTLAMLKDLAGADAAIELRQLDSVTAEAVFCLPETALPRRLTTPALFAEAIAANRCLYYLDYAAAPNPDSVLLAQGVRSLVVMPLNLSNQPLNQPNQQGAILLLWYRPVTLSAEVQQLIDSLRNGLSHLLRFQSAALNLEKLQARFAAVLETVPQAVVFIDESGESGWVNQAAALLLGLSQHHLSQGVVEPYAIAQAMAALRMRADNTEALTAQAAKLFSQPQIEIQDWEWQFSDPAQVLSLSSKPILWQPPLGNPVPDMASGSLVPDRAILGRLWVLNDITRQEQVQQALQQQNRRTELFAEVTLKIRQSLQLQEILQTAVTEVRTILNADRVLVYRLWANGTGSGVAEEVLPGFPTVLGYTFSEEVFPEDSRQRYFQGRVGSVTNVEKDQAIAPCLVDYLRQFKVAAKLVVPIVAQGELWGLLIAHQCDRPRHWTDSETELLKQLADQIGIALTQAQLLEQEIRQRQELARSNAELQQFAYIASHDLQEPLRMVTSYLQLIERRYKGKLDPDADDFIGFAVDGAIRMKTLITDLLAYSRVGTHGKSFEQTDSTLALLAAIANLKVAIEESNAVITYDPLPVVMGDPGQLIQLFQNLIGNAIKFRGEAPPIVHISAQAIDQPQLEWRFSIQDNGIGIEPQYAERIFVIFQRLHNRSEFAGTGIGLAICKKILERHDGKIWIESQPEAGTTFYFTLPILET